METTPQKTSPTTRSSAFLTAIPEGKTGILCCLDQTGDTKIVWDYKNDVEVAAAKAQFDALKKAGYIAYSVNKDGTNGEVIREFDPKAEKIILSPPMVGG
tara:strand:- start:946 stop:1245 length:300 start_codon:yes stop_codon:yes gene_type:complete